MYVCIPTILRRHAGFLSGLTLEGVAKPSDGSVSRLSPTIILAAGVYVNK